MKFKFNAGRSHAVATGIMRSDGSVIIDWVYLKGDCMLEYTNIYKALQAHPSANTIHFKDNEVCKHCAPSGNYLRE